MQYFLDHLASVLVVSVVLVIIVLVQVRGSHSAAESTINNIVHGDVINITKFLQRDLENMLTDVQAADAEANALYPAGSVLLCAGFDTTIAGIHTASHTRSFTFPTLRQPVDGSIMEVQYFLVDTGNTVTLPTQDSTQTIPLFRLDRRVDGNWDGSSEGILTSFRIMTQNQGEFYRDFTPINGSCATDLRKIRFEFKMAQGAMRFGSGDQKSTSQTNISRFGQTVHLNNWSL